MKALLMYGDRDYDFNGGEKLAPVAAALVEDLALTTLIETMAGGDEFLRAVAKHVLLNSFENDREAILYRQEVLQDCLKNPAVVRDIYSLALAALESRRKSFWGIFSLYYPSSILGNSRDAIETLSSMMKGLKRIALEHAGKFVSAGFQTFFAMIERELNDDYLREIQDHLEMLRFRGGVMVSAELDQGNMGTGYLLCKPPGNKSSWWQRFFAAIRPGFTFYIGERDERGARALAELRDRGINCTANVLAQSMDHILSFFSALRTELAFYLGALNLYEEMSHRSAPLSFPRPAAVGERRCSFQGLYDLSLFLTTKKSVVGNTACADTHDLVIVTGANQGGKSTFLRSIGLSQLMMQAGLFVPAEEFSASVCTGLFTHYKREEDKAMKSGKLDEELARMSDIVDHLGPGAIVLFNESFAATNEREGAEIARQIISALLEKGVRAFFVTHAYEFARGLFNERRKDILFLRAERKSDGERSYRILEGEPLQTSYGEDLYREIFGL